MRILALDPGTKRFGLALSDELRLLAQPLDFLPAEPLADALEHLKKLVREKQVELLIVGLPRNMDGTLGPAALRAQELAATLREAVAVPVRTWDERLTSAQAHRMLIEADRRRTQRRERVDGAAAAILLQSYLDSLSPAG